MPSESALLEPSHYAHFNGQMAFNRRFIGYPFDDVALLSVRQFCEMYVRDSFPPIPSVPLSDEQYKLDFGPASRFAATHRASARVSEGRAREKRGHRVSPGPALARAR